MLDVGAQVSTQSSLGNTSTQNNALTINVGDGGQRTTNENEQSAQLDQTQSYAKKDDLTASVGVGGDGGAINKTPSVANGGFFNSQAMDKYLPYMIVGGIAVVFMFFIYTVFGKSKKKKWWYLQFQTMIF